MSLLMVARWTLVTKRGVAARTKPRDIAGFAVALRALHALILETAGGSGWLTRCACAKVVNTGYSYRDLKLDAFSSTQITWLSENAIRWTRSARTLYPRLLPVSGLLPAFGWGQPDAEGRSEAWRVVAEQAT